MLHAQGSGAECSEPVLSPGAPAVIDGAAGDMRASEVEEDAYRDQRPPWIEPKPRLAAYAVLAEALGRESVERKAEAVRARHGHDPWHARLMYPEGQIEDALEMVRMRATARLDQGLDVPVLQEDLVELLSVSVPNVRLLAIRLSTRSA